MAKKYSGKPWILQSSHSGKWKNIQKGLVTISWVFWSRRLSCCSGVSCNSRRNGARGRVLCKQLSVIGQGQIPWAQGPLL